MDVIERVGVGRRDRLILADLVRERVGDRVFDLICVGVFDLLGKYLVLVAVLDGFAVDVLDG